MNDTERAILRNSDAIAAGFEAEFPIGRIGERKGMVDAVFKLAKQFGFYVLKEGSEHKSCPTVLWCSRARAVADRRQVRHFLDCDQQKETDCSFFVKLSTRYGQCRVVDANFCHSCCQGKSTAILDSGSGRMCRTVSQVNAESNALRSYSMPRYHHGLNDMLSEQYDDIHALDWVPPIRQCPPMMIPARAPLSATTRNRVDNLGAPVPSTARDIEFVFGQTFRVGEMWQRTALLNEFHKLVRQHQFFIVNHARTDFMCAPRHQNATITKSYFTIDKNAMNPSCCDFFMRISRPDTRFDNMVCIETANFRHTCDNIMNRESAYESNESAPMCPIGSVVQKSMIRRVSDLRDEDAGPTQREAWHLDGPVSVKNIDHRNHVTYSNGRGELNCEYASTLPSRNPREIEFPTDQSTGFISDRTDSTKFDLRKGDVRDDHHNMENDFVDDDVSEPTVGSALPRMAHSLVRASPSPSPPPPSQSDTTAISAPPAPVKKPLVQSGFQLHVISAHAASMTQSSLCVEEASLPVTLGRHHVRSAGLAPALCEQISRQHFRIDENRVMDDDQPQEQDVRRAYNLMCLGKNGVFVNKAWIAPRQTCTLLHGDVLQVASIELCFMLPTERQRPKRRWGPRVAGNHRNRRPRLLDRCDDIGNAVGTKIRSNFAVSPEQQ